MFSVALFDFDGVIADSSGIKVEGFVHCFAEEPSSTLEAIRRYVAFRGGESRFAKFRHIHESILRRPLTAQQLDVLCRRYREYVFDRVRCAPDVPGVRELLESIHTSIDCYVVSGTPQDEVRELVRHRGLSAMFRDVFGSPEPKSRLTQSIVLRHPNRSAIVFIGDAITDYEAARENGIAFLGVVPGGARSVFPNDIEVTSDLMTYRPRFPRAAEAGVEARC